MPFFTINVRFFSIVERRRFAHVEMGLEHVGRWLCMDIYIYIVIYVIYIYTIAMGKRQPAGTFWRMDGCGPTDSWMDGSYLNLQRPL